MEGLGCWRGAVTLAALPGVGDGVREGSPEADQEEGVEREGEGEMASVNAVDRPFFHVDLVAAVGAAVGEAKRIDGADRR